MREIYNLSSNITLQQDKSLVNVGRQGDWSHILCCQCHAFGHVWHHGLLDKLEKCGIRGSTLAWLANYLQEWYQCVVINGQLFYWKRIFAGVPQWFVLGPLLFLTFINDITQVICHGHIRIFADNTCLLLEVDNHQRPVQQVNTDLAAISRWQQGGGHVNLTSFIRW